MKVENILVINDEVIKDDSQIKSFLTVIREKLKEISRNGILYVDLSNVRFISVSAAKKLIRLICKRPKTKRIFLVLGNDIVIKTVRLALDKYGRAALWINTDGKAKPLGKIFFSKQKSYSYQEILQYILNNKFVYAQDVWCAFGGSRSLANYKLDRLYEWDMIDRDKIFQPSGGKMFVYHNFILDRDFELVIDI